MNKTVKKLLMLIGAVAVFVVICVLLNLRGVETFEDKYAGHDLTADAEGAVREGTYTRYLNAHADAARPQTEVALDLLPTRRMAAWKFTMIMKAWRNPCLQIPSPW